MVNNETQECVILADEDEFWWNGIAYYNKNDSSILVNNSAENVKGCERSFLRHDERVEHRDKA